MKRNIILTIAFLLGVLTITAQDLNLISTLNKTTSRSTENNTEKIINDFAPSYKLYKSKIKGFKQSFYYYPSNTPKDEISFPENKKKVILFVFWIRNKGTSDEYLTIKSIRAPKEIMLRFWKNTFNPSLKSTTEFPAYKDRQFRLSSYRYNLSEVAGTQKRILQINSSM